MGIPSLNIVIKIKFDFPFCVTISMTSYKYSKYPGPRPRKRPFLWIRHNNPKWSYQWKSVKLRQGSQINWNLLLNVIIRDP